MKSSKIFLAADLGAGSGRVLAGAFDGDFIEVSEIIRFPNSPVKLATGWHWQFEKLLGKIEEGIGKAVAAHGSDIVSVGVDTWGVDYGLLDDEGRLLGSPFQYRDTRTDGMRSVAYDLMPSEEIYNRTGIQPMFFNTLFQLLAEARAPEALLQKADTLLFLPDLINYRLTGRKVVERTIASTGQLLSAGSQDWDRGLISSMGLPDYIFGEMVDAGTGLSPMLLHKSVQVVVPGCHDTASAVAGIPADDASPVFLSSGTWSLFGRELSRPLISAAGFQAGFSNEAGVFGTTRYLRNISGLWLLQECKRHWDAAGNTLGFAELVSAASLQPAFTAFLDPDAPEFKAPEHMPSAIAGWLEKSGQPPLTEPGAVTRCILESLALKYRQAKDELAAITASPVERIYIVGGGSQNHLLNQFTANATGCIIVAGPVEATSIGNVLLQLYALGEIKSLAEGRALVRKSFPSKLFKPTESIMWDDAYGCFQSFISQKP